MLVIGWSQCDLSRSRNNVVDRSGRSQCNLSSWTKKKKSATKSFRMKRSSKRTRSQKTKHTVFMVLKIAKSHDLPTLNTLILKAYRGIEDSVKCVQQGSRT